MFVSLYHKLIKNVPFLIKIQNSIENDQNFKKIGRKI